jgi:hypothetical protein
MSGLQYKYIIGFANISLFYLYISFYKHILWFSYIFVAPTDAFHLQVTLKKNIANLEFSSYVAAYK